MSVSDVRPSCKYRTAIIYQLRQGQEEVIKTILGDSQTPYAAYLEKAVNWTSGKCYAITPVASSQERRESFRLGGFPVDLAAHISSAELFTQIKSYTSSSLFIEDPALTGIKDVQYRTSMLSSVALDKESYAITKLDELQPDQFERILIVVGSWNLWGFVAEGVEDKLLNTLDSLELTIPASDIHLIFAEVYDGDGFIFWTRSDL